ncbi:3-hydroxybutyrate dehydrogenase [Marinimicrococcus flavescens]|uniref:3-hydroxybutyrate dehydrogenase n=1 Tax=Marinimicrococcus flavescens TaxID=3031815 RepID=A0AAP3UYB7_9PROT|nr:3-hydroxybutyrate dehydrogenase [Marinimicrococcus flavescens]
MAQLSGKTALITGSTSGIGLAIARGLASQGADILLNGFGEPRAIEALAHEIADAHAVRVRHLPADMSRPAEIAVMAQRALDERGGVDILVNNAGIQHTAPVQDFPPEKWDAIIAVNLTAAFHTTRALLPAMLERGWGRIVNIASVHGLVASVDKTAYVAAKHGLVGFTKVVALETAQSGVTCNAICPGFVLTPLIQRQIDERGARLGVPEEQARRDLLKEKQPSLDFVTPEQVAAVALFLCSPGAAQIRGQALPVDGGWTAQ